MSILHNAVIIQILVICHREVTSVVCVPNTNKLLCGKDSVVIKTVGKGIFSLIVNVFSYNVMHA